MNNVSSAWNRALLNDNRDYIEEVTILLADNSTVLNISNANIWGGGFTIEDAVSEESNFQIGAAIINKFTLVLNNLYDEYNDYVFEDAVLTVRVGLVTEESTEMIQKGRYIVNSAKYNGSLITLECYDFMSKFDKPYDDSSAVTYPATLDTIVRRACTSCGVTLATTDFPHKLYTVTERPESETTTCREVISWVAQIAGCFARMNSLGYLELKWYNQSDLESVMDGLDGGSFDTSTPYSTGDAADGGTFNPWNTGYVYDGGAFTWTNKTHLISSIYSEDISVDDVVITGVRILVKTKDDSGSSSETIRAFMSGTEGYVIEISENPFITVNNAQEIVNWLGTQLNGFTFRKANVSHGSNPAIEAGDVAVVFDRKGAAFPIVVSKTTFSVGSSQTTISAAQTPTRNSAARYSVETKNYVEMRKRLKTEMTARQQAQADLAQRIASANGLYQTDVTTQGGGTKHYLHNKTNLNESDIQILVSDVGVTMTANGTDAQPTWYGLTVDGTLIANILSVSGINADWINAGQLVVEDQNGNETLFVDTQTGVVRINAASFSLTGNTIDSIAQSRANAALTSANDYTDSATASAKDYSDSQLADYKDVVDAAIEDLQDQIDGQFETYYYDYEPTLNNYPANEWTTTALKKEHEGDMFLWKSTGYAYRFFNMGTDQNPDWKWQAVSDSVASQAMAKAEDALALAGVKRRVFTAQPTPPYDQKDLWVQGANGDIKICAVSRASGTYVASDWEPASKYTDDSALTTFLNGTYATNLQAVQTQIDQKAETYYQSTDPSANWTAQEKPSHTGDLWYKTTDNSTWRYDGSQWVEQLVPTAVFDEIDEKKRIFVTQPVPPYDERDLWVQGASGDIKVCQTARASGAYNASDWVMASKYTDDTVVKSQYGTCATAAGTTAKVVTLANFALYNGARISVKFTYANSIASPTLNVNNTGAKQIRAYGSALTATSPYNWSAGSVVDFVYDGSYWNISDSGSLAKAKTISDQMTQEGIFNLLTNNGALQGVFMQNGNLYINADFIRTGTLKIGSTQNADGSIEIYNSSGTLIGRWNKNGIYVIDGTIGGWSILNDGIRKSSGNIGVGMLPGTNAAGTFLYVSETSGSVTKYPFAVFASGRVNMSKANITGGKIELGGLNDVNGEFSLLNSYGQKCVEIGNYYSNAGRVTSNYFSGSTSATAICVGRIYLEGSQLRIQSLVNGSWKDDLWLTESGISPGENRTSVSLNGIHSYTTSQQTLVDVDGFEDYDYKTFLTGNVYIRGRVATTSSDFNLMYRLKTHILTVTGTKNRLISTPDYADRLLYCYETPSPMFGDVGEGVIGEDGKCFIAIDPIFAETVTLKQYQVFLQKYGAGECYVSERKGAYFVVKGTPNLSFGWELKAKQIDFDQLRLERDIDVVKTENEHNYPEESAKHITEIETINYADAAITHIENIMKERTVA